MNIKKLLLTTMLFASQGIVAAPSAAKTETKKEELVLTKDNLIILNREVMPETMGEVILKAKQLDAALSSKLSNRLKRKIGSEKKEPLYIFVNSPGGSIQTGLELIEALKGIGRPIHTVTLFAASMAWQIVQNLDNRYVLGNGIMMSHRASGSFEGSFGGQYPSQIDSRYALWMTRLTEMDEQTVRRTNGKQTLASYQKQYSEEMWLTGAQSTEQGYSDATVIVKCDESLRGTESRTQKVNVGFANLEVNYDADQCPTNTNPMNVKAFIETTKGKMEIGAFLSKGGRFGENCLQSTDKDKLCAIDSTLDLSKINDILTKFKLQGQFNLEKQRPLPMFW